MQGPTRFTGKNVRFRGRVFKMCQISWKEFENFTEMGVFHGKCHGREIMN